MKSTLSFILASMLFASAATAAGLHRDSKGADWLSASAADRLTWVAMVSRVATSRAATPGYLAGCITEMLTPRYRNERQIADMLRNNTLAEISALCAVSAEMDALK